MSGLALGAKAPDFSARDTRGDSLNLARAEGALALVFLRYLGCPLCREAMAQLAERYLDIAARGVEVWVIVPSPERAVQSYAQKNQLPFRLISDPERRIYKQFEVGEDQLMLGTLRRLSLSEAVQVARLTAKHGHGFPEGSERQQIGVYLLDGEGLIQYRFLARSTLTLFPMAELMAAVDALPPRKVMGNG